MVERTKKGKEARLYFLACERQALHQQPPPLPQPVLSSPEAQLALLHDVKDLLVDLGVFTERDKLMIADQSRNVLQSGTRLLPASTQPLQGFSVAERCAQLGYRLTRNQQAALYPALGKKLAAEWRTRHHSEPSKEWRFIDGGNRMVSWFPPDAESWVDPIVQTFFAGFPGMSRTALPLP